MKRFKKGERVRFVCRDQRDAGMIGRVWTYVAARKRYDGSPSHHVVSDNGEVQYFTENEIERWRDS